MPSFWFKAKHTSKGCKSLAAKLEKGSRSCRDRGSSDDRSGVHSVSSRRSLRSAASSRKVARSGDRFKKLSSSTGGTSAKKAGKKKGTPHATKPKLKSTTKPNTMENVVKLLKKAESCSQISSRSIGDSSFSIEEDSNSCIEDSSSCIEDSSFNVEDSSSSNEDSSSSIFTGGSIEFKT